MNEVDEQVLRDQIGADDNEAPSEQSSRSPGATASNWGLVMIVCSFILFWFAYSMNVTEGSEILGPGSAYSTDTGVANFDRLNLREIIVVAAPALFISGVISFVASAILNAIASASSPK